MRLALILSAGLLAASVAAQTTRPPTPPTAPAPERPGIIERVPLPNEALPPEQRLKEFPRPEAAPPPVSASERLVAPVVETANTIMGLGVTIFVLAMVGLLLSGVIVFALARMVLRRTVRQAATGLAMPLGDEGTENEHHAEALADAAADGEAPPAVPMYHALPALQPDEAEFHRRLAAAVPELSVHPKVALSALLPDSGEANWSQLARLPLDFVVLRRDGAVVAVVVLDDAVTSAEERERMAAALASGGYRVLRFTGSNAPDHETLRARLLAPATAAEPVSPDIAVPPPASSSAG